MLFVHNIHRLSPIRVFSIKCPTEVFALSVTYQCLVLLFTCDNKTFWHIYIVVHVLHVQILQHLQGSNVSEIYHRRNIGQHLHDLYSRSLMLPFCWFLCNLFWPSDKSFTSIHRTSHMFILWCPCCVDFRISSTNITVITATVLLSSSKCECCLERNWFPKKIYILAKNIYSRCFSSTHFYLVTHLFWWFHRLLNLPCSVYMMILMMTELSLTNHHIHSNKSIQI